MSKPFSIQSPENIAKEYGGNKQKIASAMQMGIVDATVGVLAGMFIDRMRSAQGQEGAPQATVAQQVMGGVQAAPPEVPSPTPGGLGATQQAAPPMTPPQMGAPEEAPMGFADGGFVGPYAAAGSGNVGPMMAPQPMQGMQGGLDGLPVPEGMFDEPDNGGYADGGLVAFAEGGGIDAARLRAALRAQESGGDYGIMNAEGSGAMGAYQFMPDTARALAKRLGVDYRPDLMSGRGGRSEAGKAYQERLMGEQMKDILAYANGDINRAGAYHFAGPNEKGHGAKTRKYGSDILRRYSGSKDMGEMPERDVSTAAGRFDAPMDIYRALQSEFGPTKEEQESDKARRARAEEMASPEYYEKTRKSDMWQTLAEIGFNMASSKSPYLLQAVGEAAAAAMPGAEASAKERKALKDRALDAMHEMNGAKRKENLQLFGVAVDAAKEGTRAEQFEKEYGLKERELAQQKDLAEAADATRLALGEMTAESRNAKGLEGLAQLYVKKLTAEANAGSWKTPMGNKPSRDTVEFWARQHAMTDWKNMRSTTAGGIDPTTGLPTTNTQPAGGGQPAVVDMNYGSM